MKQFEYVIAGAGAAGLTLAFLLVKSQSSKKSILIIDKDAKSSNDRTWCFWERGPNLLEELVYHRWDQAHFSADNFSNTYQISPYQYKLIRGIDFYQYMRKFLGEHDQVTWIQDEVKQIEPDGTVHTTHQVVKANMVFDSTMSFQDFDGLDKHTVLLQHFKGYFIKTAAAAFDPSTFTYMDLDIAQHGDFRFGYVLPFSKTEALVEYTLFSKALLEQTDYTAKLEAYITKKLGIEKYQITEEEFGVIPMTDYPFSLKVTDNHYRIGISGGFAKPSTGYTFLRGQKLLAQMVENLNQGRPLDAGLAYQQKRFKKYDSTLLRVLAKENNKGKQAFTEMFRKNGMKTMFRFLDEETKLSDELAIMSSTPLLTFGKAFLQSMSKG